MNWDDLRFFAALRRHGTLTETANALGVNHTTVGRRIQALETAVGGALFERSPEGWRVTVLGENIANAVGEVEMRVADVERVASASNPAIEGKVRLTTSQFLDTMLVVPVGRELLREHPELILDIDEGVRFASLPRQEADIALRFLRRGMQVGAPTDFATRLGCFGWSVYASEAFVEAHGLDPAQPDLREVPIVCHSDAAPHVPGLDVLTRLAGGAPHFVMQFSTMYGVNSAVRGGVGAGVVPNRYGIDDGLVRLTDDVLVMEAWVVVHETMRESARVRAVYDAFTRWARAHPDAFV